MRLSKTIRSVIWAWGALNLLSTAHGASGAAFLKMGAGARATSMGSAFTSVSNDASAVYWNPSGTAEISKPQFLLMHTQWLEGMNYEFAGFVQPTKAGAFGLGLYYLSQGDYEGRDESRNPTGGFSAADMAASLTYGRKLGPAGVGANFKIISQQIESEKAAGFAFDLGLKRQGAGSPLSLGMTLQNLGPAMKFMHENYDLPLTLSGGASYLIGKTLTLALDIRQRIYDGKTSVGAGMEYWAFNSVALRAGYLSNLGAQLGSAIPRRADLQANTLAEFGAGLGFRIHNYQLDYALVPYGELGNTHRISLSAGF